MAGSRNDLETFDVEITNLNISANPYIETTTSAVLPSQGSSFNSIQVLSTSSSPTGGSVRFSYGGQFTPALPANAAPSAVKSALESLLTIGEGNIRVTGTNPWTIEFIGDLAGTSVSDIGMDVSGLSGGGTAVNTLSQVGVSSIASSFLWV